MADEQGPITVLSDDESWHLLNSVSLGRLVTHIGDQLELFPVNFVTQDGTVLFRTAEGTKLFSTVMNDKVLFEADDHTVAEGWSVIIRGTAQVLNSSDESMTPSAPNCCRGCPPRSCASCASHPPRSPAGVSNSAPNLTTGHTRARTVPRRFRSAT